MNLREIIEKPECDIQELIYVVREYKKQTTGEYPMITLDESNPQIYFMQCQQIINLYNQAERYFYDNNFQESI
jgi:hypothetical protein